MSAGFRIRRIRETFKRALRRFSRRGVGHHLGRPGSPARDDGDRRDVAVARSPSLIVCVNQATLLHDIMLLARRFCVNVLRRDQVPLSSAFSGALPAEERFGLGDWKTSAEGVTYLADAQINIFCKKAAAVPYGTHTIFIGEAETVNVRDPIEPLIYQDATYCFSVPHDSQAA